MDEVTQLLKIIQSQLGLFQLAILLGNVQLACNVLEYSNNHFYRLKD